jgi:hypothetical protein
MVFACYQFCIGVTSGVAWNSFSAGWRSFGSKLTLTYRRYADKHHDSEKCPHFFVPPCCLCGTSNLGFTL